MTQYLNTLFLTYTKVSKVVLDVVHIDTSAYRFKLATFASRRAVVQYCVPNPTKKKIQLVVMNIDFGIKWRLIYP